MSTHRNRAVGRRIIAAACVLVPTLALGAPRGAQVEHGQAQITRRGNITRITASDNAIIRYRGFDVLPREQVIFIQPSASARVLNRITSQEPTLIQGRLTANGQVYLVNPSGIIFGKNAVINAGAVYAAAGTISNSDFLAQVNHFTANTGGVVNDGIIQANAVALIGRSVANHGSIVTPEGGIVAIASGDDVLLGERNGQILVQIKDAAGSTPRQPATTTQNPQTATHSGKMLLGVGDIYSVVTHTGSIQASQVAIDSGKSGLTRISGTIDASNRSSGGKGGSVSIAGDKVALEGAKIDASGDAGGGVVKVGGDLHGQGELHNASRVYVSKDTLIAANALASGDGGMVTVWADQVTAFLGQIAARGGTDGGNGGFVEVSGKQNLAFLGSVDVSASHGTIGTLLLDPDVINLVAGSGQDDAELADNQVLFGDGGNATFNIGVDTVARQLLVGNVLLQANTAINVNAGITDDGAGVGSLTLQTQPGGTISLATGISISVSGGPLSMTAGSIQLGTGTSLSAPSISLSGSVDLGGGAVGFQSAGDVSVTGPINGNADLAIASSGTVTLGPVGQSTSLASLSVGSANGVAGAMVLNGDVSTSGDQSYAMAVSVPGSTTLTAGGLIVFSSSVDGPGALSLSATSGVTFGGPVGSGTPLASLSSGGGGSIQIAGGAVTTQADQTYSDLAFLQADTVFTSSTGSVNFNGGLNTNGHLLTINAASSSFAGDLNATIDQPGPIDITVGGDISGSFTSSSGSINLGGATIGANGGLTASAPTGPVTLTATTGDITGATVSAGGDVTFNAPSGSVTGSQATALTPGSTLAINLALNFGVDESGGVGFDTIAFSGTNQGGGNVNGLSGGHIGWGGGDAALTLGSVNGSFPGKNFALSVGGFNAVDVGGGAGQVQVDAGRSFSLTTTTAGGDTTILDNPVTSSAGAFNVIALSNNLEVHSVTTTGSQSFTASAGLIRLADATSSTGGGSWSANSPVLLTGAGSSIATNGGDLNLQGVNGAASLALNPGATGVANLNGSLGDTTPLTTLTTTGGTTHVNAGVVHTTGAQTFDTAVQLGSDVNLVGSDIAAGQSIDGAHALLVNPAGTFTMGGLVGNSTPLSAITVGATGNTAIAAAQVHTTGAQVYNNPVAVNADSLLFASDATLAQAVSGSNKLSIDASGLVDVAGSVSLAATNFSGSVVSLHTVTTTGPQAYTATSQIQLHSFYVGQKQTFDGPVLLAGADTLTAIHATGGTAGDVVHFTSTIDADNSAPHSLQITADNAGGVSLDAPVGATRPLETLQVTSGSGRLNIHAVNTVGSIPFNGSLTNVGQAYVVQRTSTRLGTISLHSTYDSAGKDIVLNVGVFAGSEDPRVPHGGGADEFHVPTASPIFKVGGDLNFFTHGGSFIMGQNQKLSVADGSIRIDTRGGARDGDAILGDLSASKGPHGSGNIRVFTGSGDIYLLKRFAAPVTLRTASGNVISRKDAGLDFVAGGNIVFKTHDIFLAGNSPLPKFASFDAGSSVPGFDVGTLPKPPTISPVTGVVNGTNQAVAGLQDLSATNAIVNPVTIVQLPAGIEGEEATAELAALSAAGPTSGPGTDLALLGIEPRAITAAELLDQQLTGRALYNDVPGTQLAATENIRVASARLDLGLTGQALATYRAIFQTRTTGPNGEVTWHDRSDEVKKILDQAIAAYRKAHPSGDITFFAWLEASPDQSQARDIVAGLRKIDRQLKESGLSEGEAQLAVQRIISKATPQGMKTDELARLVLA